MIKKYELQKGKMQVKYKVLKNKNKKTTTKYVKLNGIREKFLPPKTHHLS